MFGLNVIFSVTALFAVFAAWLVFSVCWRNRQLVGSKSLACMMVAIGAMTVLGWLVAFSAKAESATTLYYIRFVAFSLAPITNFTFMLEFCGWGKWITRWSLAALLTIPAVTAMLLWTDPSFVIHPTFSGSGGLLVWDFQLGPWFSVHRDYNYLLLASTLVLLFVHVLRSTGLHRLHAGLMLVGMLPPIIVDSISTAHLIPRQWAMIAYPFALTFMGAVFAVNILRYRLLALPPVALRIVNSITDPLYVEDRKGCLVFVNDSFCKLAGRPKERLLGLNYREILPGSQPEAERLEHDEFLTATGAHSTEDKIVDMAGVPRYFVISRTVQQGSARQTFVIGVLREITERKRIEAERELLIEKLKKALADVKTLTGLLPVCAWCKKIRDDHGYWQEVESYVTKHSSAQVTSALCPDCKESHFPDVTTEPAPRKPTATPVTRR